MNEHTSGAIMAIAAAAAFVSLVWGCTTIVDPARRMEACSKWGGIYNFDNGCAFRSEK